MKALVAPIAMVVGFVAGQPATAATHDVELWLNPSASVGLDDNTGIELETAQRFRDSSEGRVDTYFGRLWLNQKVTDQLTFGGAVERRLNDGGSDETRLLQQLSMRHGYLRGRLRLEQRFVDSRDQLGWRLRPRAGLAVPLDEDLTFVTDAELFLTLQSTSDGGDTGLTGLRTQIGFSYDIGERISLTALYLRQQDIEDGGPDEIGHAPLFGIEYNF